MTGSSEGMDGAGPTRRAFLSGAGTAVAAAPLLAESLGAAAVVQPVDGLTSVLPLLLRVNGRTHRIAADIRTTLLDALREHVGLTGSKKGCDHGQCGACTVHVDGRRVLACLTLAATVQSREVTTIEGLATDGRLHPMQQAFVDQDAFQCGYCTPGQIMSAVALVSEGYAGTDEQIREYMSGNICRCAAYPNIVAAVNQAKTQMKV